MMQISPCAFRRAGKGSEMLEQMQARPWAETRALDFCAIPSEPTVNPLAPHDGPRLLAAFGLLLVLAAGSALKVACRRIVGR